MDLIDTFPGRRAAEETTTTQRHLRPSCVKVEHPCHCAGGHQPLYLLLLRTRHSEQIVSLSLTCDVFLGQQTEQCCRPVHSFWGIELATCVVDDGN